MGSPRERYEPLAALKGVTAKLNADAQKYGTGPYSGLLKEAAGAGLDPRTISFFRQEEAELTRLQAEARRS